MTDTDITNGSIKRQSFFAEHRLLLSRVLAVVVVVYVFLFAPPKIAPHWMLEVVEAIGLIFLSVAAFGRVWCLVFVAGKKNGCLVTQGPYSVVRNPLYVFSFIGALGLGMGVENPILAAILAVAFAVYYPFVVKQEEKFLLSKFKDNFTEYCAQTPRWLPNFKLYREPQTMTVSPKQIRKGMLDAVWFIWVFALWELLELFHHIIVFKLT